LHHGPPPRFPLHAEGETSAEAGAHLLNQLQRALDSVQSGFRREAIEKAIEDVKEFIEHETAAAAHDSGVRAD
jgi:hypothetical protein